MLYIQKDRKNELRNRWLIDCHCERCEGSEDHISTSCKCTACGGPVPIDPAHTSSQQAKCQQCGHICPSSRVEKALTAMREIDDFLASSAHEAMQACLWQEIKGQYGREAFTTTKKKKKVAANAGETAEGQGVAMQLALKHQGLLHQRNTKYSYLWATVGLATFDEHSMESFPPIHRMTAVNLMKTAKCIIFAGGDRQEAQKQAKRGMEKLEFLYGKEAGITKFWVDDMEKYGIDIQG